AWRRRTRGSAPWSRRSSPTGRSPPTSTPCAVSCAAASSPRTSGGTMTEPTTTRRTPPPPAAPAAGPTEGARTVRARHGPVRTCATWPIEAARRMLMDHLDPVVAEAPERLVFYAGAGQAARDWAFFDAIVRTLRLLATDETML